MPLPHTSRVFPLICLPIVTGIGSFALTYLHLHTVLLRWQPELHPLWGWLICAIGALVILIPTIDLSFDLRITDAHRDGLILAFWYVAGVLVFVVGWSLQSVLTLGSYVLIVLLYLASFVLFGFGAWRMVIMWQEDLDGLSSDKQGHGAKRTKGKKYTEGYAQGYAEGYAGGRTIGYTEGRIEGREGLSRRYNEGYAEGHAKGYAEGRADNAARGKEGSTSFDPWRVLGLSPGATPQAIHKAFREQMKLYHPDKVAQLGGDLRETAERKTKDINRAYEILRNRS